MIHVTLKDGSVKTFENGTSVWDMVASIGSGLLKVALAAKVNGKVVDLSKVIYEDCQLEVLTFEDEMGAGRFVIPLLMYWHRQ